ncbi:hypothetical protein LLH03_12645, partial [bacterium]|nr:hypothetical protein [bacterium]
SVSVGIRAWDGKLGAFYTYRHPDPGSIPPPSFSEAEVRRRLLDAACRKLKCSQEALRAVTVKRKCFPQDKGELYGWELSAWLPGDPRVAIVHAYLVEPGGTVDGVEVRWEPRAPSPAPAWDATCARYAWPSWSADGKAIVSQAGDVRWAGYPPWDSSIPQSVVVSDLATARTFLLRPLREVGWPSLYYWDPPTAWTSERLVLPVGYRHQLLVLNLLSGETRLCSLSDYAEVKSSVAVQGDLVCVACQAWSADADIAVASLQASSDEKVQLRPLRLPGTDSNPIFAPGDACIYFAHAAPGKEAEKASWEILRARVTDGPALAPPEPVVTGLGCVGRMSFFPNGRRLLVWHGDKLDVVDVEARTRTPLDLPALHDPDLPADCPALWLRDPAVSPDGTRLAFSGYRDSGDPEHGTGFHIYLCRFDGSDLKRLTPLVDVPVEPYVYPQTGKTALDVVRETALVQ